MSWWIFTTRLRQKTFEIAFRLGSSSADVKSRGSLRRNGSGANEWKGTAARTVKNRWRGLE